MTTESNSQNQDKRSSTTNDNDAKDHEILVLQERIQELEELVKKGMENNPALGFQTATALVDQEIANNENAHRKKLGPGMEALISAATGMNASDITTITTTIPDEVIFPSTLLSKFFIASRNVKDHVKLKLNGTTVESWEIG